MVFSRNSRMTEGNPYPNMILYFVDELSCTCASCNSVIIDKLACCCIFSAKEKKHLLRTVLYKLLCFPVLFLFFLMTLPVGVIGLGMWWCVSWFRKPYRTSFNPDAPVLNKEMEHYSFASANVCLGYEALCKFNKMGSPRARAEIIGKNISNQQVQAKIKELAKPDKWQTLKGVDISTVKANPNLSANGTPSQNADGSSFGLKFKFESDLPLCHEIKTELPVVDVLCIQECWDLQQARVLARNLHAHFPYVVYDAGEHGLFKNGYILNSGLMIASKHPIIDIHYNRFPDRANFCRLTAMGCLQVKVCHIYSPYIF